MIPILFNKDEKTFTSLGLGQMDATLVEVERERNGNYTLYAEVPFNSPQAKQLTKEMLIKADAGSRTKWQTFKINRTIKDTNADVIKVYADHISMDTINDAMKPKVAIRQQTAEGALRQWANSLVSGKTYDVQSDITHVGSTEWTIDEVENARQALGGVSGSILDVWGGEYEFDNNTIILHKEMGRTAPTVLEYGRNIVSLEYEELIDGVYTSIYPYATYTPKSEDNKQLPDIMVTLDELIIDSEYAGNYETRRIQIVDFSNEFDSNAENPEIPTQDKLRTLAKAYVKNNGYGIPKISQEIDFVDLSKTLDYHDIQVMEEIELNDRVPVYYPNIDAETNDVKVTTTNWDVLNNRYSKITLSTIGAMNSNSITSKLNTAIKDLKAEQKKINNTVPYLINAQGNRVWHTTPDENMEHKIDDTWFKKNGKYTIIYRWNGSMWEEVLNDETFITEIEAEVAKAQEEAEQASQSAQDADTRAGTAIEKAGANANLLTTHQNTLNTINNTTIPSINSSISDAMREAKSALSSAGSAINEARTALSSAGSAMDEAKKADGKIADYVTRNGLVSGTTVDTKINDATGEISKKITTVESKIPTEIGGRNLLPTTYGLFTHDRKPYGFYKFLDEPEQVIVTIRDRDTSVDMSSVYFGLTNTGYDFTGGRWFMASGNLQIRERLSNSQNYFSYFPNNEETLNKIFQRFYIQIEKGSIPSDWSPAPEDNYTQEEFKIFESTYDEDVKGIRSSLSSLSNDKLDGSTYTTFYKNEYEKTAEGLRDAYEKIGKVVDENGNTTETFAKAVYDQNATSRTADFKEVTKDLVTTTTFIDGIDGVTESIRSVRGDINSLGARNYFIRKEENVNKIYTWGSGVLGSESGSISSDLIEVKEGDVFSSNPRASQVGFYDINKSYLGSLMNEDSLSKVAGHTYANFTVPSGENIYYMRVTYRYNIMAGITLDELNVMLNKGNVALDWTPAPEESVTQQKFDIFESNIKRDVTGETGRLTRVEGVASTAVSTAGTAKTTADTAKSTADTAKSTASTAKSTADTAKSTADTAKSTASTAKTTADTAKSTADTAKSTAETAKSTFDNFYTKEWEETATHSKTAYEAVTKKDAEGDNYIVRSATYKQGIKGVSESISSLETAIYNGSENYWVNSAFRQGDSGWGNANIIRSVVGQLDVLNYGDAFVRIDSSFNDWIDLYEVPSGEFIISADVGTIDSGGRATLRFALRLYTDETNFTVENDYVPFTNYTLRNGRPMLRIKTKPFQVPSQTHKVRIYLLAGDGQSIDATRFKLEKGKTATAWSPSYQDMLGSEDFKLFKTNYERDDKAIKTELGLIDSGKEGTVAYKTNQALETAGGNSQLISTINKNYVKQSNIDASILADKKIKDTRSTNQLPSWYFSNYPSQEVREFKQTATMGIGSGTYGILTTNVPWTGSSGGTVKQSFETNTETHVRQSNTGATAWGAWSKQIDTGDTTYQKITQTSSLYERVLGSTNEATVKENLSRIIQTSEIIQQEISRSGDKNLIPYWEVGRLRWADGQNAEVTDGIRTGYIYREPNTSTETNTTTRYTFSNNGVATTVYVFRYKANGEFFDYSQASSFNLTDAVPYARLVLNGASLNNKYQLERGDKATYYVAPSSKNMSSTITQLADNINLKVSNSDLLSQINVQAKGVLIQSGTNKLNITPTTTYIQNGTIKSAMIESLDAGKITAGTLDASKATITNIDANNITANKTSFVQSVWNSLESSIRIDGGGLLSTASDKSQVYLQNGVVGARNPSGATIGQIGYAYESSSPWYSMQISHGSHFQIRMSRGAGELNKQAFYIISGGTESYLNTDNIYLNPSSAGRVRVQGAMTVDKDLRTEGTILVRQKLEYLNGGFIESQSANSNMLIASSNKLIIYTNGTNALEFDASNAVFKRKISENSDARLKTNIVDMPINSLEAVRNMEIKKFDYLDGRTNYYGIIAQQAQQYLPELINTDSEGYLMVDKSAMTYVNMHAIQQLDSKVDDEVAQLKAQVASLQEELATLKGD